MKLTLILCSILNLSEFLSSPRGNKTLIGKVEVKNMLNTLSYNLLEDQFDMLWNRYTYIHLSSTVVMIKVCAALMLSTCALMIHDHSTNKYCINFWTTLLEASYNTSFFFSFCMVFPFNMATT